jgi:hypothetical protein
VLLSPRPPDLGVEAAPPPGVRPPPCAEPGVGDCRRTAFLRTEPSTTAGRPPFPEGAFGCRGVELVERLAPLPPAPPLDAAARGRLVPLAAAASLSLSLSPSDKDRCSSLASSRAASRCTSSS